MIEAKVLLLLKEDILPQMQRRKGKRSVGLERFRNNMAVEDRMDGWSLK